MGTMWDRESSQGTADRDTQDLMEMIIGTQNSIQSLYSALIVQIYLVALQTLVILGFLWVWK